MNNAFKITTLIIIVGLVTGCAKERNNYDKWLTDGEWTVNNGTVVVETLITRNYVDANETDYTDKHTSTTTISSGQAVISDYNENDPESGITTFNENISTSSYTAKITFNEDGTFTLVNTTQLLSTQHKDEDGNDPVNNVSQAANTQTSSGYWTWQNTTDTKSIIEIENLGIFEVEISKDELKISKSTSAVKNTSGTTFGGEDYSETETTSTNIDITLNK